MTKKKKIQNYHLLCKLFISNVWKMLIFYSSPVFDFLLRAPESPKLVDRNNRAVFDCSCLSRPLKPQTQRIKSFRMRRPIFTFSQIIVRFIFLSFGTVSWLLCEMVFCRSRIIIPETSGLFDSANTLELEL